MQFVMSRLNCRFKMNALSLEQFNLLIEKRPCATGVVEHHPGGFWFLYRIIFENQGIEGDNEIPSRGLSIDRLSYRRECEKFLRQ